MLKQNGAAVASKSFIYNDINYNISYKLLNQSQEKTILFLHGWGANKELMQTAFGKILNEYCHIYIDLPGFGNSSIEVPLSSKEVKEVVEAFLKEIGKEPLIVAGHSFGGKVALLLNPKRLILFGSAGIVLPKRFSVRFKIRLFKILKSLGFGRFYSLFATEDVRGMSKCMYEMLKIVVDEDMSESFKAFKNRAYIFWGKDDNATPLVCGEKIASYIKTNDFFVYEGDHFFFLDKGERIEADILRCEERL